MPPTRSLCLALAFAALAIPSEAAEVAGKIKSVDAAAGKIVVTPKDGAAKAVELTVKDTTSWTNAKGKAPKKFELAKVKKGTEVDVTYDDKDSLASKVVITKKAEKKNPNKAGKKKKADAAA